MADYQNKSAGFGLPMVQASKATLVKYVDVPQMIADGVQSGLALVSAPDDGVALPSTGFAIADTWEIFWVPKGTVVTGFSHYVITAEGAAGTFTAGVLDGTQVNAATDADGWGTYDNNGTAGTWDGLEIGDAYGDTAYPAGILYITNGSIDLTFAAGAQDTTEFIVVVDAAFIGALVNPTRSNEL